MRGGAITSIPRYSMATPSKRSTSIKWDEEVIAEHDKLRGTRMKIDEPDTPFAYGGAEDGLEEVSPDKVGADAPMQTDLMVGSPESPPGGDGGGGSGGGGGGGSGGLGGALAGLGGGGSGAAGMSLATQWSALEGKLESAAVAADAGELLVGADAVDAMESEADKKAAFKAKRSAHYNEFQLVQQMRARQAAGEDDDDDDDDDDGGR